MASADELAALLTIPNESLTVEYKGWLDLGDAEHRGTLAKAAIALANEGGGYIVLGYEEVGRSLTATPAPVGLPPYDQDGVNNAIRKFAEPRFHCTVVHVTSPGDGTSHPIVIVPGGHGTPVISRSSTPRGSIGANTCYVRKPGPESAPPLNALEWTRLLDRCLRNRRADMLDAIRGIVQGGVAADLTDVRSERNAQDGFVRSAQDRWETLVSRVPEHDPARCTFGRYEIDFHFAADTARLPALLDAMRSASGTRFTGWPPFWLPDRSEITPSPVDGTIECWLGLPETQRLPSDAAHCDFWRVAPGARAFLLRGFQEDGLSGRTPGTVFDATLPIWRVGETLLYAARFAAALEAEGSLDVRVCWQGLRGRRLTFVTDLSRSTGGEHRAAQDKVEVRTSIPLDSVGDNLPEVLHPLLEPLYETFSFFALPGWLVSQELAKMRRRS